MNALRRIHAVLVPDGLLVDTEPISPCPPVRADHADLGTLDMRDWRATIDAVDRQVALAIDEGLYRVEEDRRLIVTDAYDDGPDFVACVKDWQGTRIPAPLASRLAAVAAEVSLRQEVRLRLLRALEPAGSTRSEPRPRFRRSEPRSRGTRRRR